MLSRFDIKKKILLVASVILFVIAIPLTLIQVQKQQEIKQRAAAPDSVSFEVYPLTFTKNPGDTFDVKISFVNTDPPKDISAFDVKIAYNSDILKFTQANPSSLLTTATVTDSEPKGSLRYVWLQNPNDIIPLKNDLIELATLTFQGKTSGKGTVSLLPTSLVTSIDSPDSSLTINPANNQIGEYTITAGAAVGSPAVTDTPTPTSAPASTACSSATTCATCIFGPTQSACGWNGSSCENRPGQSSCPAGYSQWNWTDCSINKCSLPTPPPTSAALSPTPIPAAANTVCPIETNDTRIVKCDRTNPNIGVVCNPLYQQKGLIPCQPDDICWICRFPTPTPIPSAFCNNSNTVDNDCFKRFGVFCAVNSSCIQNPNNNQKDCICGLATSPAPTPNPALPAPNEVLLNLSVKINGIPVPGKNPRTVTRPVTVIVQSQKGETRQTGTIKLSTSDVLFKTDPIIPINLGAKVPVNTPINLVIKSDFFVGFLPNINLQSGQNSLSFPPLLQVGIGENGNEDAVSYYNALVSCFGSKVCANKNTADLNDDGKVDGNDFNFFVRSLAIIEGLIDSNALTKPIPTLTPTLTPLPTSRPTPTP